MIRVTITNLSEITSAFAKAPREMVKNLNIAISNSVFAIKSEEFAQYKGLGIQVISGGLWGSMQRGQYLTNLKGEVGPNVTGSPGVDYATYVHEGTRFMRARPFLLNAVEAKQTAVQGFFDKAVQDTLDDIARST